MKDMFHSATLKLTLWYLLILASISISFSFIIFQVASSEIDSRLEVIEQRLLSNAEAAGISPFDYDLATLRLLQTQQAQASLFSRLLYINALFLALGGIASYFMARRTLEPIERSHEAQSRFTSDASHELRTPLAAMKTELEVALRDSKLSKQEMRELLSSNLEEVDKLSKITQSLLLLSRLEHSALTTRRLAIDDIIRRSVDHANKHAARIIYTPAPTPLYISAHQVSIEELITILIDNALKYSAPKSKIRITLTRKGRKARFQVSNIGKGIAPEDLPYIFERFFRVDESRTNSNESGYGLGLSLAKKIVEIHKGDLSVTSQPGKQTTFTVSLPLYVSNKRSTSGRQQSAKGRQQSAKSQRFSSFF